VARELEAALTEASGRWKEMKKTEVAALNQQLEKEKAAQIDPERREKEGPSSDVDGDDEP